MKKIIATAITLCIVSTLNAQFEKGSKWIAGNFSFSSSGYKVSQTNTIDYNVYGLGINTYLNLSKFTSENKMQGFILGYSYAKSSYQSDTINKNNQYMHNFSVGYSATSLYKLFPKVHSTLTANIYGQCGFSNNKNEYLISATENISKRNYFSFNVGINLGLLYRVNDRFAITTSVNNLLYFNFGHNTQEDIVKYNLTNTQNEHKQKGFSAQGGLGLAGFNLSSLQFGLMYQLKK